MIKRLLVLAAIVLSFLVPAAAANAQYIEGQPGCALNPTSITPGGTVTASCFGCPRGSTAELSIAGTVLGSATAASDGFGSFSITFRAPAVAGNYDVVVSCGSTVLSNVLTVVAGQQAVTTTGGALPVTGSDSGNLVRIGMVLVAVGGLVLLATRRRATAST
ncbi:MAG: LPXTG cell wall anchor domain-containing protein [Acidimicrobiales bacterium]|nr:LPXTG cell wall anchor domain-containing protein [Acidimicrobiales bacterium]